MNGFVRVYWVELVCVGFKWVGVRNKVLLLQDENEFGK